MSADLHTRSYVRPVQVLPNKNLTFGVGANMEYYGSLKNNEFNIAAFLQVALF
ncbi:hypothetical protein [Kaistella sp.]|uniref:hypothetical protein n=1 Tax=Kaistella sp. TaxID=2782235 RepID=UPI002F95A9CE